jgi:hypothetical protein
MTTKIPVELSSTPGIVDGSNATAITIDSSENVAIGRTSNIAHPLDIQRADNAYIRISSGTTQENAGIIFANQNSTKWTLEKEGSAHSLFLKDASSTAVTFAQGGNVGIGTTSPSSRLHLVNNSSNNFSTSLRLGQTYNSVFSEISSNFGGSMTINAGEGGGTPIMHFQVNDSEKMRINSTGGVGIGTTSTGSRSLSVSQLTTSDACILAASSNSDVSSNAALLQCQFQGDATPATGSKFLLFVNQSDAMGSITAANASTVAFNTSSDERLKENIVDASSQLQTILKTKVREFNWKKDGVHNLGFIAQELNEFIPDVVHEGGDDETENPWQVDYGKITPYLVKAIQEQQEQIEQLKTEIQTLKGE